MKKNFLVLILLFFIAIELNAKVPLPADSTKLHSKKLATADLKKGEVKFLIRGGIVSTVVKGQELFEEKYNIRYYDFGCIMPENISIEHYNKVVAYFMDKKYGRVWRKEVRRDIIGI